MTSAELGKTFCTCLTPPGRGAIAVIAVRGPLAWQMVRELFCPRTGVLPDDPAVGQFRLGRFKEIPTGPVGEEVVLAVKQAGAAPWLEVQCHGGPEAVRLLLEAFVSQGAVCLDWEAFERATDDRADLVVLLAQAPTARTAAILLDQYHGACARAVEKALDSLRYGDVAAAKDRLGAILAYASVGRHLTTPWRVVILGPPNVGKSSLVNALAGYQRSIVAGTPGTTRDVTTTTIAVDGWLVEIADTAGLREAENPLESQGIERAREAAASADLRIWVLDASQKPVWPTAALGLVHLVVNKIDLPAAWDLSGASEAVAVSTRTGAGIQQLCGLLSKWLVPDPPPSGAAVPFSEEFRARLEEARALLLGREFAKVQQILLALLAAAHTLASKTDGRT